MLTISSICYKPAKILRAPTIAARLALRVCEGVSVCVLFVRACLLLIVHCSFPVYDCRCRATCIHLVQCLPGCSRNPFVSFALCKFTRTKHTRILAYLRAQRSILGHSLTSLIYVHKNARARTPTLLHRAHH